MIFTGKSKKGTYNMTKHRKIFGACSVAGLVVALGAFLYACIDTGIDVNSAPPSFVNPELYNGSAFWNAFFWNSATEDTVILVGGGLSAALIFLIHFLFHEKLSDPMTHRSKILAVILGIVSGITAVLLKLCVFSSITASFEESQVGWYVESLLLAGFIVLCVWLMVRIIIEWVKNKSLTGIFADILLVVAGFLPCLYFVF